MGTHLSLGFTQVGGHFLNFKKSKIVVLVPVVWLARGCSTVLYTVAVL